MAKQLIQGVYFTAPRNLDAVDGPGMIAATVTAPDDIRAMDTAASLTNFQNLVPDQTEYTFLYTSAFGFCTAAVQTRTAPGQNPAPYVHMIFSGAHPSDPPRDYGFQAVFRTDQYPFPSPTLPYLPANPLPAYWNAVQPDYIRPAQLAGLIHKLWQALCPDEILKPLLISPESLPRAWMAQSPSTTLMCLMCTLAELIPPSLRRYLRGTTASPALRPTMRNPFPVRLTNQPNALRLDDLPEFIPEEGDYFGSLCSMLAVSCLEERKTGSGGFRRLLERVENDQFAETVAQNDRELIQLAAFCSLAEVFYTRMLESDVAAAMKRLNARLSGMRTRRDFWQSQRTILSQYRRPKNLRELLPWMDRQNLPEQARKNMVHENYAANPDTFVRQYDTCIKTAKYAPLLLSFWESVSPGQAVSEYGWTGEQIGELMNGLMQLHGTEGLDRARPDAFYPAYRKEMRFWWPYVSARGEILNNFCYYFVGLMMDENTPLRLSDFDQLAELAEYTSFWNAVRKTLIWKTCAAIRTWDELPPLRELKKIPPDLRHDIFRNSDAAGILETLWRKKQRKVHRHTELESWREVGIFLEIPQAREEAAGYIEERLNSLRTVREISAFADSYLPLANDRLEQRFRDRIDAVAAENTGRDELEELRDAADRLGGNFPPVLERNLRLLDLMPGLADASLAELLDEFPGVCDWPPAWVDRWRKCLQERVGQNDSLTRQYAGQVRAAAQWLQESDPKLADSLCMCFFRTAYPGMRDFHSFRQFPAEGPAADCFDQNLERHIQTLLREASVWDVFRLYQVNQSFPRRRFPCPAEPWRRLDTDDQCQILLAIEKNGRDWAVWRNTLYPDAPFCQLLRHLFDLYGGSGYDREIRVYSENPRVVYACIRELVRQPKADSALIRIFQAWGNSRAAPDEHSCQTLARILRTLPNAARYRRQTIQCWKQAYRNTPRADLLERYWPETAGNLPLPSDESDIPYAAQSYAELSSVPYDTRVPDTDHPTPYDTRVPDTDHPTPYDTRVPDPDPMTIPPQTDTFPPTTTIPPQTGTFPPTPDSPSGPHSPSPDTIPGTIPGTIPKTDSHTVRPLSIRVLLTLDALVFVIASLIPLAFRVILSLLIRLSMLVHGGPERIDPDMSGLFTFSPNAGQIHDFLPAKPDSKPSRRP